MKPEQKTAESEKEENDNYVFIVLVFVLALSFVFLFLAYQPSDQPQDTENVTVKEPPARIEDIVIKPIEQIILPQEKQRIETRLTCSGQVHDSKTYAEHECLAKCADNGMAVELVSCNLDTGLWLCHCTG
ncbi:MAG: hypothetical protein JW834_04705 [Candidatus Diapherotrites archaeon]|nr:hypothetical protein [Candidatus Diapherotrites archaeon]